MNKCLNPIDIKVPPAHTQIQVRCCTCNKWPVCNIREDYLKTAYLIQQILGDPQEDFELCEDDCSFIGHDFEDITIFPETITVTNSKDIESTGTRMAAKYKDKDHIKILYNIDNYYVMFALKWDEETEAYKESSGREIYYNLLYTLSTDSTIELTAAPLTWREEMIAKEETTKDADVINTTYFSANLNCDFYEWQKGLTENEGWRRIELQYKDKIIPSEIEHLLTYHIEPNKVPFNNLKHTFAPMPALYPIYLPKPPCPPPHYPPQRRDDING